MPTDDHAEPGTGDGQGWGLSSEPAPWPVAEPAAPRYEEPSAATELGWSAYLPAPAAPGEPRLAPTNPAQSADDPDPAPGGEERSPRQPPGPSGGSGPAREWSRRRRFGAVTVAGALVAGAAAGAVTAALLNRGNPAPAPTYGRTAAASATSTQEGTAALVAEVEPGLVDIHASGTKDTTTNPAFGNGTSTTGKAATPTLAAGTGMILNADGLILTNAHVLAGSSSITVTYDGETTTHPATLVGEDAALDVALIQVSGASNLHSVTLGDSSTVRPGDSVLAIGNALDLQAGGFTVSNGIISGTNRSIQTDNGENLTGLLQTSAAISSGDSGGPLVNTDGQVIAMNTASATSTSTNTAANIGFSIPINVIKGLIPQLENGTIGSSTAG